MSVIDEYRARLEARKADTTRCDRAENLISNLRLGTAVAAFLAAWTVFGAPDLKAWWLIPPAAVFLVLVVLHERVVRRREFSRRAEAFYERGLARLEDRWPGTGEAGENYLDPLHPYAADLDVFGRGSLFELLCTARTRAGRDALAEWLAEPAQVEQVRERQASVAELADRLDLREEVALLGDEAPAAIDAESLEGWGHRPFLLPSRIVPVIAGLLGVVGIAGAVIWLATDRGPSLLILAAILELVLYLPFREKVAGVIAGADRSASELGLIALVLSRFEQETFESPRLAHLASELDTDGVPPSRRIRSLTRLIQLVDTGKNQLFMPIAWILMWDLHLAFAVERWRRVSGEKVGSWLKAAGEIEALLSLAGHSYEHPEDPFPALVEEGPVFRGEAVGHPLLSETLVVRNDVDISTEPALLVVSGSNMAGKSTLLRTVGANAVLAQAGAPVRARTLTISRLMPAASIHVQDSLLDGASRFFAEIKRLKLVVDLAGGEMPVLFLLDELLHGTNSHDRAAGAEALVKGLVEKGAIGLVTTHDLALGAIAESLSPRASNVHFEDRLEKGEMAFDYTLRPGVVTRSNALALMRAVGLDV